MTTTSAPPSSSFEGIANNNSLEERLDGMLNAPTENDFLVAEYLNLALSSPSGDTTETLIGSRDTTHQQQQQQWQQLMAEQALQLQWQTAACHEEIGRLGAELQAIVPRCAADVGRIGFGLQGLQQDAATLLFQSTGHRSSSINVSSSPRRGVSHLDSTLSRDEQVENPGAAVEATASGSAAAAAASIPPATSSLETLSTLHALRAHLSRTREILLAASTWDTTLQSVAPLLAQQNLTEAVHALAQLEQGERALRGMPHPEQRVAAIAKIRQQVSVLLQPQLKHALSNMHSRLAPLQQCVALYSKLNLLDNLQQEYVKNRPTAIHKAWFDYHQHSTTGESAVTAGTVTTSDQAAQRFLTWLPGWYEAVLSLLAEERRQARTIFGAELSIFVVIHVFQECFRPILPSFKSRLESIVPSNPTVFETTLMTTNVDASSPLESICALYESTLRFLSMVYETIAAGWLDMVDTGVIHPHPTGVAPNKNAPVTIYKEMSVIFLQIASPFAPYQQQLAELETKYFTRKMQGLSRAIRQVVEGVSGSDQGAMQQVTDQLSHVAFFVFPHAEGAVARFELLCGGHGAITALSSIDQLLTDHAGELATGVRTIAAAIASSYEGASVTSEWDESHVLCALDVLKVAGRFNREMKTLERKTRERLSLLSERMIAHAQREEELEAVSEKQLSISVSKVSSSLHGMNFSLPDSLSAVAIDSFLTKVVCAGADGDDAITSLSVLQRLAANSLDDTRLDTHSLFPKADDGVLRFAQSCHALVFDICSAVPRYHLAGMSSMDAWKEKTLMNDPFVSYGTLPQQYITLVGEHMLALVQALEPFASHRESLSFANEVMSGVRDVALPAWCDFLNASGTATTTTATANGEDEEEDIVHVLMDGKELIDRVLGSTVVDDDDEDGDGQEDGEDVPDDGEDVKASAAFCNAWLDAVGLAVTGRLLERIMRIPSLTSKGSEHLNADLNYLVNAFSALGISGHPHPLLGHLAVIVAMDGVSLTKHIATRDRTNPIDQALCSIEERLGAMRGAFS